MKKIINHLKENWIRHGFETLVVTVGILGAFTLNNWNEWRKDRLKEKEILTDLIENLNYNKNTIQKITGILNGNHKSSNIIINTIEKKKFFHDSLGSHMAIALNPTTEMIEELTLMGYESMKNNGFDLIINDTLKKEIVHLFEITYKKSLSRHNRVNQNYSYIQILKHKHLMRLPEVWAFTPFNFESLTEDKEFLSWLYTIRNNRGWIKDSFEISLTETQSVLQKVNKHLTERKLLTSEEKSP